MANQKQSRLAQIYGSELKSGKGAFSGLSSAVGKRALEKIDIRNALFGGSGIGSQMGRAIFGKGYSAAPKINTGKILSSGSSFDTTSLVEKLDSLNEKVDDANSNLRIIAKKSLVLSSINHDSNIIRQNSSKLVKLMGGTAAKKTDMFFKSAKDRESEYENQFSKEKKSIKEDVKNPKESGRKSAGLGGTFGKLFGKMIGTAGSIASIGIGIGGFLAGIGAGVWALDKLGGPKKLEETLLSLATGLNAFNAQSLLALGAVAAMGAVAGAAGKSGKSAVGAGTMLGAFGAGLGGFIAALGGGIALASVFSSPGDLKDWLTSLAEGLNAFDPSSLEALGAVAAVGAVAGAVSMAGGVALGAGLMLTAVGAGMGGFIAALSLGISGASIFSSPDDIKNWLEALATGFDALGAVEWDGVIKAAGALTLLGPAMAIFFGGKGLASVLDVIGEGWSKIKELFGGEKEKSLFEKIADQLKPLENVNADKIKAIGDGLSGMASGLKTLTGLSDKDLDAAKKAIIVGTSIAPSGRSGTTVAPSSEGNRTAPALAPTPAPASAPAPTPAATSTGSTSPTKAGNASIENKPSENLINTIKQYENPKLAKEKGKSKAFWDYKQYSIGYGTEAKSPDEEITEAEASKRLEEKVGKYYNYVVSYGNKKGYNWNQGQIDALTSFAFNLGTGAIDQVTDKGKRSNDEIMNAMAKYNKAGGKVLEGLDTRRKSEIAMFSNKASPSTVASAPTTGSSIAATSSQVATGQRTEMAAAATPSAPSTTTVASQQQRPQQSSKDQLLTADKARNTSFMDYLQAAYIAT